MEHRWIMTCRLAGACIFLWLVATALPAWCQEASLRGLAGVRIEVAVNPVLIKDGLAMNQVKADVEATLQEAGIRILADRDWRDTPGRPKLLVQVSGNKVQENWKFYTFAVNLYLLQDVFLVRDAQSEKYTASTWFDGIAANGYLGDVRTRVKEMAGLFAAAFRAANP